MTRGPSTGNTSATRGSPLPPRVAAIPPASGYHPTMARARARSRTCLALALLASCGRPSRAAQGETWRRLAEGFRPRAVPETRQDWRPSVRGGPRLRIGPGARPFELEVEAAISAEQWVERGLGVWSAERPVPAPTVGLAASDASLRLGTTPCARLEGAKWVRLAGRLPESGPIDPELCRQFVEGLQAASFLTSRGTLFLFVPGDGAPGPEAHLTEVLSLGNDEYGVWRVPAPGVFADGIPVLAGGAEELVVDVPADSALRCATIARTGVRVERAPPTRFRVLLDGEPLLEHDQAPSLDGPAVRHALPLGRARSGARLRFEVEGPACYSAFLTPIVGPARSTRAPRPDVVFLLADTYRADNLAAWGGDARIAPHLNALSETCRRFRNAQAAATWTLPSHATLFSGLYPRQTRVLKRGSSLAPAAHTLAEHFAAAGYRTVAVTEGAFVSSSFGLDQGFEWFEEHSRGIDRTVARALELAEVDDGRPLFLFAQSYRAHDPYVVSDATRARLAGEDLAGSLLELDLALGARDAEHVRGRPYSDESVELARAKEALYRGASADLDEGFGRLLAGLEPLGRLEPGDVLAFTSDHGEAFGEHGVRGHGMGTWLEEAHVPLLLRGPGVEPGDVDEVVGAVSLPRTLARLAGLEPAEPWLGRDLCELPPLRAPIATYQCSQLPPSDLALNDGQRKLILRDARAARQPAVLHAYDLRSDPRERADSSSADWVEEQARAWAPALRALAEPVLGEEEALLGGRQQARLRELGYGGD